MLKHNLHYLTPDVFIKYTKKESKGDFEKEIKCSKCSKCYNYENSNHESIIPNNFKIRLKTIS